MGFIVKAVKKVVKTVVGVIGKVAGGIFGFLVPKKKKNDAPAPNNLSKQLDPEASRKIIFGKIAAPLDIRYWQVWGTDGKNFDEVICVATHTINDFKELYCEKDLAINATGNTRTAKFEGLLNRDYRTGLVGQAALGSVGGGTIWTSTAKMTGCAHMVLRWTPDEKRMPNGIPSRLTQICEGALVYDPRRDSTVPGGSGTHRIDNQATWSYSTLDSNGQPIGRNNALQALWYLIGWRIANPSTAEKVLVAGRGVEYEDINLATFIAGANACEAAGYYTDMVLATDEDHTANEDVITCDGLIGRLIDPGGLWSYYANVNDTANVAAYLTDDDVLDTEAVQWDEFKGFKDQFNQVGGKFINPSAISLYQAFPYPLVRDATYEANLGVKRRVTQDFRQVLDNNLAQRLARLKLNANQYQGTLNCAWNYKALRAQAWSIVQYQSERFGWTKLFRVWRHEISTEKGVSMTLEEVHSSIWSAGTITGPLSPAQVAHIDAMQPKAVTGLTVTNITNTSTDGTIADGVRLQWDDPGDIVRDTEIRLRPYGTSNWLTVGKVTGDTTAAAYFPLLRATNYEAQVRHITTKGVIGAWAGTGTFISGSAGNMSAADIAAAATTADWANVTGVARPEDYATQNAVSQNLLIDDMFINKWTKTTYAVQIAPTATSGYAAGSREFVGQLSGRVATTEYFDSEAVPVTAAKRYYFSVFMSRGTTLVAPGNIILSAKWRDAAGTNISNSNRNVTVAEIGAAGARPAQKTWSAIAPTGAVTVELRFQITADAGNTGNVRFESPRVADVGSSFTIAGQTVGTAQYNYQTQPDPADLPKEFNFSLLQDGAAQVYSSIVWTYQVTEGTVNGFTSASGVKAMNTGSSGVFTLTTMGTATAAVKIMANYNGNDATPLTLTLARNIGAAPAGAGGTPNTQNSGFNSILTPWTSFVEITQDAFTMAVPTGKTTVRIAVSLAPRWNPKNQGFLGPWNIEYKVQRESSLGSNSWADVGSFVGNSNPDPYIEEYPDDVGGSILLASAGDMSATVDDTGRTAGVTYSYRIVARVSSGNTAGNTGGIQFTGSVTLSCP